MLIDQDGSEVGDKRKLDPITFTYEQAQAARNALKDAHKYVCKPSSLVADNLKPVEKLNTAAALCRDAGFLTADLAAACGGMVEPTGLVLFTSAKSVVTSSTRIKKTIDDLNISKPDQRKATGKIHESTSNSFDKEKAINQIKIRQIKSLNIKKIKGFNSDSNNT